MKKKLNFPSVWVHTEGNEIGKLGSGKRILTIVNRHGKKVTVANATGRVKKIHENILMMVAIDTDEAKEAIRKIKEIKKNVKRNKGNQRRYRQGNQKGT